MCHILSEGQLLHGITFFLPRSVLTRKAEAIDSDSNAPLKLQCPNFFMPLSAEARTGCEAVCILSWVVMIVRGASGLCSAMS